MWFNHNVVKQREYFLCAKYQNKLVVYLKKKKSFYKNIKH